MNLALYEHLSKLEIIVKNVMQNGAKFPGTPAGIFLKTFPGILEQEFLVALRRTIISPTIKVMDEQTPLAFRL